jgi:hypothetical protein
MLVFICTDGIARMGDGGGVTAYDNLGEIAGLDVPPVHVDVTVEQLTRTLSSAGRPWWLRTVDRFFG